MKATIRERWSEKVQRLRNRKFLDAAMAAAALVSAADEDVRLSEQLAIDDLLERLERLRVFDPHAGVDIHRGYADQILADRDDGRKQALASVTSFRGDEERGLLILYVGAMVARADGDLSTPEMAALAEISGALGLPEEESLERIWGEGEPGTRS